METVSKEIVNTAPVRKPRAKSVPKTVRKPSIKKQLKASQRSKAGKAKPKTVRKPASKKQLKSSQRSQSGKAKPKNVRKPRAKKEINEEQKSLEGNQTEDAVSVKFSIQKASEPKEEMSAVANAN